MHNALPGIINSKQFDAVPCAIFVKLTDHARELRIGDIHA